jgi:outer membrane protein TolC
MTLREAIDLALAQNPDVMLSRLDQQKAREQVTIVGDAFHPKVFAGSGAAYSHGFPASIDGAAPAIANFKTQMSLFDQPQRYQVAAAKENVRGAEIDVTQRQQEVAYRVASLYLEAERAAHSLRAVQQEVENLKHVSDSVKARVEEGRDTPLTGKMADRDLSRVRRLVDSLQLDLSQAETSLAMALGMQPDDRVQASPLDRAPFIMPQSEDGSISQMLETSLELKRIESQVQSKQLEMKSYKAQRLPKADLVLQDEIFTKYTYQNFFATFQRNSVQAGASFTIPLWMGKTAKASMMQVDADIEKLRIQAGQTRARITADVRRAYQEVKRAEDGRDFARLDLDVAREQVSVNLSLEAEGKVSMAQVEQSRADEQAKWLAYFESQNAVEVAKLNVLRQTGTLLAAVK